VLTLLCPEAPLDPFTGIDFFANDRNEMLKVASELLETKYARPADALIDVASVMGFEVVGRLLGGQVRSYTVVDTRTIYLCTNLCQEDACFALAKEIGHIRLHLFDGVPVLGPEHVQEAKDYASVFLGLVA
jgi:Zn-dependent peptidase ImmA (M78 family)